MFTSEDLQTIPDPVKVFEGESEDFLNDIIVTEKIVQEKLELLNTNKSQGPNERHPKLVFELRHSLAIPLAKLFQKSLRLGIIPQDWRDANIAPLHKKAKKIELKTTDQ